MPATVPEIINLLLLKSLTYSLLIAYTLLPVTTQRKQRSTPRSSHYDRCSLDIGASNEAPPMRMRRRQLEQTVSRQITFFSELVKDTSLDSYTQKVNTQSKFSWVK